MSMWQEALYALGLLLLVEGALYAVAPDSLRRMLTQILSLPDAQVRNAGLIAAAIGLGVVWLVRSPGL
ncbi:MAG: DUF2065 domain-containing protein [Alphaproteobacteria bacterium]